ncbi:hypothetical protein EV702DRAFT_1115541, partial [Suillus placidus]
KPHHLQSMQIPMLRCSDPSSVSTSARTLAREKKGGGSLLDALISALIEPVPFGVDGEMEKDDEFQENVVNIFATSCNGAFSAVQKRSLWGFLGGIREIQLEGEGLNFGLTSGGVERCEVIVRCNAFGIGIVHKGQFEIHQREWVKHINESVERHASHER